MRATVLIRKNSVFRNRYQKLNSPFPRNGVVTDTNFQSIIDSACERHSTLSNLFSPAILIFKQKQDKKPNQLATRRLLVATTHYFSFPCQVMNSN